MAYLKRAGSCGAIVLLGLVSGCGASESSPKVRALKNDPMGRYVPPGARLIESRERNEGSTFGKPFYPEYLRTFELPPGDRVRQIQHAADAAAAAGWTLPTVTPSRSAVYDALVHIADKELAAGRAKVEITLFPHGPPSGETRQAVLLIRMRLF